MRKIAVGETATALGQILLQVLKDDGTPCTDLVLGDLWVARNGDATYTAATGTLTAITLAAANVGTYRYAFGATEKAVLGQGLIMVKKTGVLYQPTEFLIAAHPGVADEPLIGAPGTVQSGTNTTTAVTLGPSAPSTVAEYEGAEFRVIAGTNRGVVRTVDEAVIASGKVQITLDAAMANPCDTTTEYIIVPRGLRGLTMTQLAEQFGEFREGAPPAAGIPFIMRLTDGSLAPGATVSVRVRNNAGAYAAATNAVATEVGDGEYRFIPTAGEFLEGVFVFEATASGCVPYKFVAFIAPAA